MVESHDSVWGQMQKGSELGTAQEQVSQPKHREVAKPMGGQSRNVFKYTTTTYFLICF